MFEQGEERGGKFMKGRQQQQWENEEGTNDH